MREEDIHTIQLYLSGDLEPDELDQFKTKLASDEELRQLLKTYQQIELTMSKEQVNDLELKHTLQSLGRKYFLQNDIKHSTRLWPRILAAAAVVVIALVVFFALNNDNDDQELYASYAKHDPLMVQERGETGTDSLLKNTATFFNNGQYAQAKQQLSKLVAIAKEDQFKLALAISQIETSDYESAEQQLQYLISSSPAFADEALWYMILLKLKQGNKQGALNAISKLPSSSKHSTAAAEIKNRLLGNDD